MKTFIYAFSMLLVSAAGFSQSYSWGGRFGGEGEDVVLKMHVDAAGNSYTTGYFTNTSDFDISDGVFTITTGDFYEAFVQKTDTNGNFVWAKKFGGESFDNGTDVTTDAAGNVYVTGVYQESADFDPGENEFILTSTGGLDIFVVKLDPNGNFIWAKSMGGTEYEETSAIDTDALGNIYLSGYFYNEMNFDAGQSNFSLTSAGWSDGFVTKLNSDGTFAWAKQFGGDDFDLSLGMKVMPSGDLYFVGNYRGTADFNPDPAIVNNLTAELDAGFLLHLTADGDYVNAVHIGEATQGMNLMSVDVDALGSAYITGYFGGELALGLINGVETNLVAPDFYNGLVLKVNTNGSISWATQFTGEQASVPYTVAINTAGETLVSGFYGGTLQMGDILLTMESENAMESFLAKLDANGNFTNGYRFGGINFVDKGGMGIDAENNIYVTAAFDTTADINPDANGTNFVTSAAFRDNFLIKMSDSALNVKDRSNANSSLLAYPNPATTQITLDSKGVVAGLPYEIADVSGRIVQNGTLDANQQIDLSNLHAGVYVVNVGRAYCKIIKY